MRPSAHAQPDAVSSTGARRASSWAGGRSPTMRSTSTPSCSTTRSGMLIALHRSASPGFSSTLTCTSFRCPAWAAASLSRSGVIVRQGAHHGAQKSTMTGTSACVSASKDASSAVVIQGSRCVHRAHRGTPSALARRRFLAPQLGQRTVCAPFSAMPPTVLRTRATRRGPRAGSGSQAPTRHPGHPTVSAPGAGRGKDGHIPRPKGAR
jgi:hypothetical protein